MAEFWRITLNRALPMIITCPECATRYEAASKAFEPDGRKVRCTSCAHTWFQMPEDDSGFAVDPVPEELGLPDDFDDDIEMEAEEEIVNIEAEAARLASASRSASRKFAAKRLRSAKEMRGWLALAACLVLFFGGGYVFQVSIVRAFPAAAQLYAGLGVIVNTRGFELHNVVHTQEYENGIPVLAVRGHVVNITGETSMVPRLRFGLMDESGQEIYHWTMIVHRKPLEPETPVQFATRLASPPAAARSVQVRFLRQ